MGRGNQYQPLPDKEKKPISLVRPKGQHESFTSTLLRNNASTSGWLDTFNTSFSAATQMLSKTAGATDSNASLTNNVNNFATQIGLVGAWGFFFNNLFYFLRIALTGKGKQNRAGKIAYSILGICAPLIVGNSFGVLISTVGFTAVLASAGFTMALLALPWIYVVLNLAIILRNSVRLYRTHQGLDPSELLKQKIDKLRFAKDDNVEVRKVRFDIEKSVLELFLQDEFKTLDGITKEEIEKNAFFKKYKDKPLQDDEDFLKTIRQKLQGKPYTPEAFQALLKDADDAFKDFVKRYAVSLFKAQQDKYEGRKKSFILSTLLCSIFIAMCVFSFLVTLAAVAPAAFPALVAAAAAFKLTGAGLGLGVFFCMSAFSFLSIKGTISTYQAWQKKFEAHQHDEDWKALKQAESASMGLRISGTALFLASSLLIATAVLPFVNLMILGIIGAALAGAGIALFVAGAATLHHAREKERAIFAKEDEEDATAAPQPPPSSVSTALSQTATAQPTTPAHPPSPLPLGGGSSNSDVLNSFLHGKNGSHSNCSSRSSSPTANRHRRHHSSPS